MQQSSELKQLKRKIPKHLEEYLPEYVIMYGEPYLLFNNSKSKYELQVSIPLSDYFLKKFQEFYNLGKKPEPQQMLDILQKDVAIFIKKLDTVIVD